ncbi:MAG: butyrate kinase [Candidatus Aerophobetes bacterium]|nr:butyrate kinase [Candidatus Aerophobetes bacterium]
MKRILVINPGSISTKLAVFEDEKEKISTTLDYSSEELSKYPTVYSQYNFRKKTIIDFLKKSCLSPQDFDCVVGRGGLLHPVESGTFVVNEKMKEDMINARYGEHASNLGAILADELTKEDEAVAFIVDPVVVDEMVDFARLSGHPMFKRTSIFHALNQKAVARYVAKKMGKGYEDCNFVVAHMGGGVSVGTHMKGRVVDVNNALNGDGPFSPERSGTVPTTQLLELCFSGKWTFKQMKKKIKGKGGLVAHLDTNDVRKVLKMIEAGDEHARLIFTSLVYQISKWICKMATILKGEMDAIILTGGLAHSERLVSLIKERIEFLAPVEVVPGGNEMRALALGALRALRGEEKVKHYG